jgi:hypothetical protein
MSGAVNCVSATQEKDRQMQGYPEVQNDLDQNKDRIRPAHRRLRSREERLRQAFVLVCVPETVQRRLAEFAGRRLRTFAQGETPTV